METFYQNTSNSTHNNGTISPKNYSEDLAKIEIILQAIILYMAIFGNAAVLVVFRVKSKRLSRMQWFIVHLCFADIFVAFFNVLPQLIWDITFRFQGNNFLCKLVKYFQLVAMYASSYVLVVTALDRYISICHPLTSHTWSKRRRANLMVFVAWLLALFFSIPQLFLFAYMETSPGSGEYDCWETMSDGDPWEIQAYLTWIFLSIYFIPFLILTFAYTRICYVVFSSVSSKEQVRVSFNTKSNGFNKRNDLLTNPRAHTRCASKSKKKTIYLTLTVVLCYLICWGPFFIAQMWAAYDPFAPFTSASFVIILLLASLNSCTNPWIYLAFSGMATCCKKRSPKSPYPQYSQAGTNQTFVEFDSCSTRGSKNYETKQMIPIPIPMSDKPS
ncbi:annetocin receptor-like [Saccostrea echinata]|uniref:annetocin receptor-like n=1 Tax=Saccostrea echinata TaxID=191078 RepID=UPI002A835E8E|nr:annetocin receptor-like [Saccostrea echinata]